MRRFRPLGALLALWVLALPASPVWLCLCTGDLLSSCEACTCCCMAEDGDHASCGAHPGEDRHRGGDGQCPKLWKVGGHPRLLAEGVRMAKPELLAIAGVPAPDWAVRVLPPFPAALSTSACRSGAPPPWKEPPLEARFCVFLI